MPRPLSKELVDYARTDVHFLVYIAEVLRSELAAKGPNALEDACRRSHLMSLNLYSKPTSQVRQGQVKDPFIALAPRVLQCAGLMPLLHACFRRVWPVL